MAAGSRSPAEQHQPERHARADRDHQTALARLGLKDRSDPAAEMVARKIVEIARGGERDPERLSSLVVKSLQG